MTRGCPDLVRKRLLVKKQRVLLVFLLPVSVQDIAVQVLIQIVSDADTQVISRRQGHPFRLR